MRTAISPNMQTLVVFVHITQIMLQVPRIHISVQLPVNASHESLCPIKIVGIDDRITFKKISELAASCGPHTRKCIVALLRENWCGHEHQGASHHDDFGSHLSPPSLPGSGLPRHKGDTQTGWVWLWARGS